MPDSAGEVGSEGGDLEGLERDPIFDTQESQVRARPQSVVQPGASAIFQTGRAASEGGVPEPTKGMVVVRGQEGMKKYHHKVNRTSVSSKEETYRPMAVDQPIPQTAIPSSQPMDDEQVVFHPARSDDSRPPAECIPPPTIVDLVTEMKKWSSVKDTSFFSSLSLDEL